MTFDEEKNELEADSVADEPETPEEMPEEAPEESPEEMPEETPEVSSEGKDESAGPVEIDEPEEPIEHVPQEVLLSRLESLIFSYPEPITVRRLGRILSLKGKRVRELVAVLQEQYSDRGILISEISGGFHFHTNPKNADVVRAAVKVKPMRISRPALETLAIVAYRQPVTRADVEDIRRVDSGGTLRFLFEKGLIRVLGRKEEPGRPMIYGTSANFLELFGLKSLNDLPSLHEFTELWEEHQDLIEEDFPDEESDGGEVEPSTRDRDESEVSEESEESEEPEEPEEPDKPEENETEPQQDGEQ